MVRPKQVCVIGAGVSGLAAAKAFAARGHRVTIVERSGDLGGVWEPARSYPEVQTQSPKDLYRYTDKAMPDILSGMAEGSAGPRLSRRLCEGPRARSRMMRFNTDRRRHGAPRRWQAGLDARTARRRTASSDEDFDFVAVCTGQFNEPQDAAACPGEDGFKAQGGRILHSSQYNDPALAKGHARSSCSAARNRRPTSP